MFYDNYIWLCNKIGKSPSAVAEENGFKKSTVTGWKRGSTPTDSTLQKLADYFGISKTDLTGETILKVSTGAVMPPGQPSSEAMDIAMAFDRADTRTKDLVRLALEPFAPSAASDTAM